jgi:hypothetical protein
VRPWPLCALLLTAAVGLRACGGDAAERGATPTPRPGPAALWVQRLPCAAGFGSPKREWFRARYPRWSLRIGPVTFLDVRRAAREPLARRGGAKFPVLLKPNRSVTIAIGVQAREAVGLVGPSNPFPAGPGAVPDNAYAAVHLHGWPANPARARIALSGVERAQTSTRVVVGRVANALVGTVIVALTAPGSRAASSRTVTARPPCDPEGPRRNLTAMDFRSVRIEMAEHRIRCRRG